MPELQILALPNFERALKRLAKRFPGVIKVVRNLVETLKSAETPGDKIPSSLYDVYKVRLPNPDSQRGKSGGFRVIYYLRTTDQILLVHIYSKSDQENVSLEDIAQWIKDYEAGETSSPEEE